MKAKYSKALSWGDLSIFAGNVALEDMGSPSRSASRAGRADIWEPRPTSTGGRRRGGSTTAATSAGGRDGDKLGESLDAPLGAVQMGLIYVNPEGPGAVPDPLLAAKDIKETFARMAMNDEETVALIAGGHTFGKAHGAGDPEPSVGPEPEGASLEERGFGWTNTMGTGKGVDAPRRASSSSDPEPDRVGQRLLRQPVRLRALVQTQVARRRDAARRPRATAARAPSPTPTTRAAPTRR